VQGEDGKKFATRAGVTVKLKDLLDEAVRVAAGVLAGGEPAAVEAAGTSELDLSTLSEEQLANAKVIGIGAVKYADLSMNRESNYRFRCVCGW
jgi:arginyl-tRNA synthetase